MFTLYLIFRALVWLITVSLLAAWFAVLATVWLITAILIVVTELVRALVPNRTPA